jgi:hypothetical protein
MAQRTNTAPFGDIVLVNTPALDKWGQQLYLEQRQRELRAQEEGKLLDANVQKELGKVRSVDAPDVIKNWQEYKTLKKNLYFNKELQKDPVKYNEAQLAAQKKYQDIFTISKRSSELNDLQKSLTAGYMKDPNSHADDAGVKLNTLMKTPISALSQPHAQFGDLTNMENYLDRSINTDFGKLEREAIGKTEVRTWKEERLPGGLQIKRTPYEYGLSPLQVKDNLLGSMGMRQAGKDAAKAWDRLPESDIEGTIKAYRALPKEYWERIGVKEPQDLFPKNPDSKAENFASYMAMKYAVANAPREGKVQVEQDLKAVKDLEFKRQQMMQRIKLADAKELAQFKKDIDPNDTDMNNVWYEKHLDNLIEGSKAGERRHMFKGTKSLGYYQVIKPDAFTAKAFARDIGEPDRIGVNDKGEIIPIFYKYDDKKQIEKTKNGDPVINDLYSQPMSYEQALVNLGYRGATKKQLGKDLQNVKPKQKSPSAGKPKTVVQNGHTYTLNESTGEYE